LPEPKLAPSDPGILFARSFIELSVLPVGFCLLWLVDVSVRTWDDRVRAFADVAASRWEGGMFIRSGVVARRTDPSDRALDVAPCQAEFVRARVCP
jgi:hypothetical protein